ncbi:DUF3054 domain-containing protein [Microbacterium sp. B2969]|uniref:DUF3054 domain-containing protein n=1 Tax=Microbacterium alkaliflavum TaxID=3248839 RepID=A0ABW7Q2Y8_9MICO
MASTSAPRPVSTRLIVGSLAIDAVLVVVFAAIGRASHDESVFPGLAITAWPFLAGLALGWLLTRGWLAPTAPLRTGLPVWAVTLAGGMLLRAVSGQGVAIAFIIVAGMVLFAFLVGWRGIAALIARRRASR